MAETVLIKLGEGEELGYSGPDTGHIAQLASDVERIETSMVKAIQAGALNVTTSSGNTSRMSGISRLREYGAIAVHLMGQAESLHTALNKAVQLIAKMRKATYKVLVTGADNFDMTDSGADLDQTKKLLDMDQLLPIPFVAKKELARKLLHLFTYDSDVKVQQDIHKELEAAQEEKPEPEEKPDTPVSNEN